MKLPLMAAMTALLLGGCAHEGSSRAARGTTGTEPPPAEAFASDQFTWDATQSPRTQAMLRSHGMNFYGQIGAEAQAHAEGTGGSGASKNPNDYQCVDVDTLGTGGSGDIDMRKVDTLAPAAAPSQSVGARLDITPEAWNRNKSIGVSPVAPSTGTPPEEGSGGAGG
jgi:hypothetical protein